MSREELEDVYRHTGEVRTVRLDGKPVGTVWIEHRGRELHVHGILVEGSVRGQGIGAAVLQGLESELADRVDFIELGVRSANQGARRLYEREGFRNAATEAAPGFVVMRKHVWPKGLQKDPDG
jgi:ribosomal protein S18 acetylase RimI-like enzyme